MNKLLGRSLTPQDAPDVWAYVRGLAAEVGCELPDHVVVGLDPTFFVSAGRPVPLWHECVEGQTLFISLSFARIMTHDELRAMLGHELGHIKERHEDASLPAQLAADQVGARIAGAHAMATAVVKLAAFGAYWNAAVAHGFRAGETNYSHAFAEIAALNARLDVVRCLVEPPRESGELAQRLHQLGTELRQVEGAALHVRPHAPASQLIPGYDALEEALAQQRRCILDTVRVMWSWQPPLLLPERACVRCGVHNLTVAQYCYQCGIVLPWSFEDPDRGVLERLVAGLGMSVDDVLSGAIELDEVMAEVKWRLIQRACRVAKDDRRVAAHLLGIKPRRLVANLRRGRPSTLRLT